MPITTAWVGVDTVDQLTHGVLAIANHMGRIAPGCGHHLVPHHQQTEVVARQITLHHHLAIFGGGAVSSFHLAALVDVDRDAFALVAVLRFHDHGHANLFGHSPGIVHRSDGAAPRNRNTSGAQQGFGEVFVLCNGFGHGTGGIDFSGLNAALFGAPTELHHAALGEAAVRNATRHSGVHDGACAGAKAGVFVQLPQPCHGSVHIKRLAFGSRFNQGLRQIYSQTTHGLFAVLHHHLVNTGLARGRGAAEGDGATGLGLQRQGRALQYMGKGDGVVGAAGPKCADGREQGPHGGFKARTCGDGTFGL